MNNVFSKIAFLGTGIMGFQMARRLAEAGCPVTVWNRSAAKAKPLEAYGAKLAGSAVEAVAGADLIIAMLADFQAAESVYFDMQVIDHIVKGALLADMATYASEQTLGLAEKTRERGIRLVDAPVSGGERGAAAGTLSIMAGGCAEDVAALQEVFALMGRVTHVGPVGSGAVAKMCNQLIVGNTVVAVAEALNLAAKLGADAAAVQRALVGGFADSVILKEHGVRMLEENFVPGGPAKYMQQILVTARNISSKSSIPLPLASVSSALFDRLIAAGDGDLDLSAVFKEVQK